MSSVAHKVRNSSINRALNVLGDVWTLNILRHAFLGVHRFSDFLERMPVPRQTLTNRLRGLVEHDILYTRPYQTRPLRLEYRLTQKGLDLYPFILMIWRWQRRWSQGASMLPRKLAHKRCGKEMQPRLSCSHCRDEVHIRDVSFEDGPGAGFDVPAVPRVKRWSTKIGDDPVEKANWGSHAANLLGDRWSHSIINAVFLGCRSYDGLQRELSIASNILAHRLKLLLENDFLKKIAVEADTRRFEYLLTEKSRLMFPITLMLIRWGDRWLAGPKGPPMIRFHRPCGHRLDPRVTCSVCGEELFPWDVTFSPDRGKADEVRHDVADTR